MDEIVVHSAPLPFSSKNRRDIFPVGTSVRQIIDATCREEIRGCVAAVVMVNGEVVTRKKWKTTVPNHGDMVNIKIIPAGGGGGGKSILTAVLMVAVMLVAAPLALAAAGAVQGTTFAAGTAFSGVLATSTTAAIAYAATYAAVSIIGLVAASALMSVAKPSAAGTISDPSESQTQFIEGASNSLNPFGVVPVCLGTNRMFPPQAARLFTETENNDQYVRQLFTWGFGEQITVTDLKIGDSDLTDFTDYEIEHKLNGNLHEGTQLYTNDVFQTDYSVLLTQAGGYTTRTLHADSNEALIDLTFSRGLCAYNASGNRTNRTVSLEISYAVSGTTSWSTTETITVTASTAEALRKTHRFVFPVKGDYDIRVRRTTPDSTESTILDVVYLTATKSIEYTQPVRCTGINGTAIRIKGTDQLNGSLSQLNGIVSNLIPDYDVATDTWITRATSNPASIYVYVLRGLANARPLPDAKIDLVAFKAWHTWCESRGYTYDRVIDYQTSVDEVLRDIAAAGCASPAVIDGLRGIVVDKPKEDIIQLITPRNSKEYKGDMNYPDLPDAIRVTFRNKEKGYVTDERIVYNDGFDEDTANLYETYEVQSCTNAALAYKYGRRIIALAKLRPETHSVVMDFENLVATRGDRIKLEHDIPLVGVGDGRIKVVGRSAEPIETEDGLPIETEDGEEITTDGSEAIAYITVDDTISIPNGGTYYVRIRKSDGSFLYKELLTSIGRFKTFYFAVPFSVDDAPEVGDLCAFFETGGELDCIITKLEPLADLSARLTLQNYAPGVFDAETGVAPEWESKVTTPLELRRPNPPVLVEAQVDESVLIKNADGTFTSRAVFTLENTNDGEISTEVKIRRTGDTLFSNATILETTPEKVSITDVTDNTRYDIHIRYKRRGSSVYSLPLQLNNLLYVGASGDPSDVTGFDVEASGDVFFFKWDRNTDVDHSNYVMRYNTLLTGALYEDSVVIDNAIYDSHFSTVGRTGTYFVKAVDLQGNESTNAAVVVAYNYNLSMNAVETISEHPSFSGVKDNVEVNAGILTMTNPSLGVGYYYFANSIDLLDVFPVSVTSLIRAYGVNLSDSNALNNVFDMQDVFSVEDIFGVGVNNWLAMVQFRSTTDDPADSAAVWSDWTPISTISVNVRGLEFRLKMESLEEGISPAIAELGASADMPDRVERGENLTVPVTGTTITYSARFFKNPSLAILIQDGSTDDKIEFISKTASGFEFKVYNATTAGYVERTYDYIASGYGRITV